MAAAGPSPRILDDTKLVGLLEQQQFGVLATVKRTGHPHLSTVLYHWSAEERLIRVSTTLDRLKVRHLNNSSFRSPRALRIRHRRRRFSSRRCGNSGC